ncbi:MAG: hypothetical protein QF726_04775, partial [Alphaproteobacteria bacterium]|nr:hypothetical protein [Alphaproteobacteria bacterium]
YGSIVEGSEDDMNPVAGRYQGGAFCADGYSRSCPAPRQLFRGRGWAAFPSKVTKVSHALACDAGLAAAMVICVSFRDCLLRDSKSKLYGETLSEGMGQTLV